MAPTQPNPVSPERLRLSDPVEVGKFLQAARKRFPKRPVSRIADTIPWEEVPDVDTSASLVQETVAARRRELEERAAGGDKFAQSMLTHWQEKGTILGYESEPAEG